MLESLPAYDPLCGPRRVGPPVRELLCVYCFGFLERIVLKPQEPRVLKPCASSMAAARAAREPWLQRVTMSLSFGTSFMRRSNWPIGMFT